MSGTCSFCGSADHTQFLCQQKPHRPITVRRRLNQIGKQSKRTAAAVAKWKRTQKPNHQGYYQCYMCGKWIPYLTAEHVLSKVRHPESRTDLTNLKPTCTECNAAKGSKDN